jgi:phosphate transport system protein
MIAAAVRCLVERNEAHTAEVFAKEREVNRLQLEVDDMAVKLTALQQPVANDVRFLFMASRIVSELERVADQAINIAQNAHHVLSQPALKPMVDIPIMAEIAQRMVKDSITAMIDKNVALADHVLEEEYKVDAFKDQIFRTLLTYMMADPGTIQRALSLILISRNLERVGDHATNIAEEVIYIVQGRDIRHPKSLRQDGVMPPRLRAAE